jgi:hypothetical protein
MLKYTRWLRLEEPAAMCGVKCEESRSFGWRCTMKVRMLGGVLALALLIALTAGWGQALGPGTAIGAQPEAVTGPAGVEGIVTHDIPILGRLTDAAGNPVPDGVYTTDNHKTLTFVVRLWREAGQDHWRGRVEHVASQEVGYVEDVEGVVRFIERWTGEPGAARTAETGS